MIVGWGFWRRRERRRGRLRFEVCDNDESVDDGFLLLVF